LRLAGARNVADGTVIVGIYYDSSVALHGFHPERSQFMTYDVPGAADTELTSTITGPTAATSGRPSRVVVCRRPTSSTSAA
jgi:hypothetical protein